MTTLQQPATIIGGPVSPYVRKVLVACELKGVPYRLDPIVPFFGGDKFSELNPLRRIPVYIDDKVSISDSTVICEYLDQRFADPPILPADVAQRAQARWIEEFADTRLGHVAIRLFYESVVGPLVFQAKRDKDRIAAIVASEVPDIMATLERLAPADGFLFEQPCVADVSVAVFFANLKWARLELDRNRWPKALTWVDRTHGDAGAGQDHPHRRETDGGDARRASRGAGRDGRRPHRHDRRHQRPAPRAEYGLVSRLRSSPVVEARLRSELPSRPCGQHRRILDHHASAVSAWSGAAPPRTPRRRCPPA